MLSAATRTTRTSALGLVLANLLPVVGVLALGWSPFTVVMAYVLETVIVGLYAWLRILQPLSLSLSISTLKSTPIVPSTEKAIDRRGANVYPAGAVTVKEGRDSHGVPTTHQPFQ